MIPKIPSQKSSKNIPGLHWRTLFWMMIPKAPESGKKYYEQFDRKFPIKRTKEMISLLSLTKPSQLLYYQVWWINWCILTL